MNNLDSVNNEFTITKNRHAFVSMANAAAICGEDNARTEVQGVQYENEHGYEPWDLWIDLDLNACFATAIKYMYRHEKKNGHRDIAKAIIFMQKAQRHEVSHELLPFDIDILEKLFIGRELSPEFNVCKALLENNITKALLLAVTFLNNYPSR